MKADAQLCLLEVINEKLMLMVVYVNREK